MSARGVRTQPRVNIRAMHAPWGPTQVVCTRAESSLAVLGKFGGFITMSNITVKAHRSTQRFLSGGYKMMLVFFAKEKLQFATPLAYEKDVIIFASDEKTSSALLIHQAAPSAAIFFV